MPAVVLVSGAKLYDISKGIEPLSTKLESVIGILALSIARSLATGVVPCRAIAAYKLRLVAPGGGVSLNAIVRYSVAEFQTDRLFDTA